MAHTKTGYGRKNPGNSPFILVAPHGAGDDAKTGLIAHKLAKSLDGALVLNNIYKKPTNKSCADKKYLEDFNDLSWGHSYNKYLWKKKVPEMKQFYKDIESYCTKARNYSKNKKAIVIYIHGMSVAKENIDIGAGAKKMFFSNAILGSKKHRFFKNRGKITLPIALIKKLKFELQTRVQKINPNSKVTIGKYHPGWSKQSAVQFHKHEGRNDYAIQLEIGSSFRHNTDDINNIVEVLTHSLKNTFLNRI